MKRYLLTLLLAPSLLGATFDPLVTTKTLSNYQHNVVIQGNLAVGAIANVESDLSKLTTYLPTAERFGAVANDEQDDYEAITNCLGTHGVVNLGFGTYLTSKTIDLPEGGVMSGKGINSTTLKLMDDSEDYDAQPAGWWYWVVTSHGTNAIVQDLHVDANMSGNSDGSNLPATSCVWLYGGWSGAVKPGYRRISRVKATGWGIGDGVNEVFVLYVSPGGNTDASRTVMSIIEDCEVTGPFSAHASGWLTCILSSAGFATSNSMALVRGNWVHDILSTTDHPTQPLNGLSVAGHNALVTGNQVNNFYGRGFYIDSWTNTNIRVEGNIFKDVLTGISLTGGAAAYSNVVLNANTISTPLSLDGLDITLNPFWNVLLGINLYSTEMDDIVVSGNYLDCPMSTRLGADITPRVFRFALGAGSLTYSNIVVANNTLRLGTSPSGQQRDVGVFYNQTTYDPKKFGWYNNRYMDGTPARLFLWDNSGVEYPTNSTDNTFAVWENFGDVPTPVTNTTTIWLNRTNESLMMTTDDGTQLAIREKAPAFTGLITNLWSTTSSNILYISNGIITNIVNLP